MRWILIAEGANGNDPAVGEFVGTADEAEAWFVGLCEDHGCSPKVTHHKETEESPRTISFEHEEFYGDGEIAEVLCKFGDVDGNMPYAYVLELRDTGPGYRKFGCYFS